MNFKITNNEYDSIKVEVEFNVDTWEELQIVMSKLDDEFGI